MQKTLLKGGSLAGTYLIKDDGRDFVRKEISLDEEREYGYYRWYSQLKRLQRYEVLFPGTFSRVINYGVDCRTAYFDLVYYPDAINCHTYICSLKDDRQIKHVFHCIMDKANAMYDIEINSFRDSILLYFEEEINSKINECMKNANFRNMHSESDICVKLSKLKGMVHHLYNVPIESYTHGNITLENILYLSDSNDVIFIDPYEENIIDNKYNEYSQLLQSCNSHYELLCENDSDRFIIPYGLQKFNELMTSFLNANLTYDERKLVKFFECSQYFRMLPFKLKAGGNVQLFYNVACRLMEEVLSDV